MVNKDNNSFNQEFKEIIDQEQDIRECQPYRKYKDYHQHFSSEEKEIERRQYMTEEESLVADQLGTFQNISNKQEGTCNAQFYSLYKGLKKFKDKGKKAAIKKITQLYCQKTSPTIKNPRE